MTAQELILAHTDRSGQCWLWQRSCQSAGYPQARFEGAMRTVHRLSYEAFVGPIPDGLVIDHRCCVKRCVNPAHLAAVSERENILRGTSLSARRARQTHCHRGHPLPNPIKGHRQCVPCVRHRERETNRLRHLAGECIGDNRCNYCSGKKAA